MVRLLACDSVACLVLDPAGRYLCKGQPMWLPTVSSHGLFVTANCAAAAAAVLAGICNDLFAHYNYSIALRHAVAAEQVQLDQQGHDAAAAAARGAGKAVQQQHGKQGKGQQLAPKPK